MKRIANWAAMAAVSLGVVLIFSYRMHAAGPDEASFSQGVKPIHFEFDTHENAKEQQDVHDDAEWLKAHPNVKFKLAGYADPRGDVVYNLVLSDRRAKTVRNEFVKLGVSPDQIVSCVGWGELYPTCREETEECHKQDRRVDVIYDSE